MLWLIAALSAGPAGISAPDRLVLGRDVSAQIRVKRADVRLLVNVGLLSPLRDGVAVYQPPTDKYPQILLVAAVDESGALIDWLQVPLYGQGVVDTKAEPRADVTALVADQTFGPVRADAKGRVRIPILAPPGVGSATAVAKDALGNQRQSEIDLNVPPFSRTLAVCPRSADRLIIVGVEPTGAPSSIVRVRLSASRGTLAPARMLTPGVFESVLTLPESTQVGDEITLGAGQSKCSLVVEGFTPAKIAVALEPLTFTAGSGAVINATVTLTDSVGRPAQAALDVTATMGITEAPRLLSPGKYAVRWRPANRFASKQSAYLQVQAAGLRAEARLGLTPARGQSVSMSIPPSVLEADGRANTELTLRVLDDFGNSVPEATLQLRAQGELAAPVWHNEDNAFHARYTAPSSYDARDDIIIARDNLSEADGRLRVPLIPKQRLWMVGVRAGASTNIVRVHAPYVGVEAARRLPGALRAMTAGLDVGFLWASFSDANVQASLRVLPMLARLRYGIVFGRFELQPSIAAGVSLVYVASQGASGNATQLTASFAASGSLGVAYWVGPGQIALDVGYWYTRSGGVVAGNIGGLLAVIGYRFAL